MSSSYRSLRKAALPEAETAIIEEKIVKSSGEVSTKRYSKGRFLGKGGFARVYEFTSLETKHVSAAKIVPKAALTKARQKQKLMSEIKIHRSLHHAGVVGFEHFFEDAENVYLLLELCPNQTLSELLKRRKRLTDLEVQCYTLQCISALKYIHTHRVIHRDIKLGNLFLNERMELKLGDFGLATKLDFDGERKRTICGTPNYIAPEVLEGKQGHSYEVDIWSLGVVIYTLLVGKPPFETSDVKTTYKRIKMNSYTFPDHIQIAPDAKNLITRILHSEPAQRPSLDDILGHEFFHRGNAIPKLLPASTLAVPPSKSYIDQFISKEAERPLADTQPVVLRSPKDEVRAFRRDTVATTKIARSTSQPQMLESSPADIPSVRSATNKQAPMVWVTKWIDYTSKYGLGYLLSNGCTGVFFNDSTKMVLNPFAGQFTYYEKAGSDKLETGQTYPISSFPSSISKKVTLLQHFRNYLETGSTSGTPVSSPVPYVKKWTTTDHATIFRMSHKVVQVCFQDKTELILSSESKIVTFVKRTGERETMTLTAAMESDNTEMTKRLKYTKDVLARMMQGHPHTGGTSERRSS